MKIGFVLDDCLDRPDGVQQYVLTLGTWLSNAGHEVHYLVGETKRDDIPHVHSLSRNVQVSFNHNRLSIPLGRPSPEYARLLKHYNFDVLHVQMPYSPLMAGRIIKQAPATTAIIGTFHIAPYSKFELLGVKLLGVASKGSLRKFNTVIAVSSAAATTAASYGLPGLPIMPNVVNSSLFAPPKKFKRANLNIKIVYLGRLVARKGARELLAALTLLPTETRRLIEVRIGGRGELLNELESYVRSNGLADIVSFDGFISEADKPAYLASADIAVFPSTGGESFGIVLLEAMAAGSGVALGGNNPGYASVLANVPESIVTSTDPGRFSQQLERFIVDESFRKSIGDRQQKVVKTYDIQVVGPKIVAIYNDCITQQVTR